MKKQTIGYWAATGLAAFAFLSGGVMDLVRPAELAENMARLGYAPYFMLILGVWKVLGAITILAPRLPLLKEWAYAGMVFDLTGAAASHLAVGDAIGNVVTPLVLLGIVGASWALRPADRKLPGVAAATHRARAGSEGHHVSAAA